MLVVADTSPLNYLVWIESVEVLPRLFGKVIVPLEVCDEAVKADRQDTMGLWWSKRRHGF